jgi:peptidoglycan/LPS O-acetylase OafA/YrhL
VLQGKGLLDNRQSRVTSPEPQYMPQLDSLRAFAVLAVLVAHNWNPETLPWVLGGLNFGDLGVRLFYVLSGYLITRILLGCRTLADARSESGLFLVRQFYARRFLRIFPIYYLMVAVALAINIQPARAIWPWLVTYTTNLDVALYGHWIGRLGHFWSLAVEEQFYFVWPWLVLVAPRRWLAPTVAVAIGLAPLYRLLALIRFPDDFASGEFARDALTLGWLDSLGAGVLVALAAEQTSGSRPAWPSSRVILPIAAITYVLALVIYQYLHGTMAHLIIGDVAVSALFYCLVSAASRGLGGPVGRMLELKPLVYAGKISYGIYVYHTFPPALLALAFARFGVRYQQSGPLNFALSTVVTVAVAAASWRFLERPMNSQKRHFPYAPGAGSAGEH